MRGAVRQGAHPRRREHRVAPGLRAARERVDGAWRPGSVCARDPEDDFLNRVARAGDPVYLSVITIGEPRRGVELIRLRGDVERAGLLEAWLSAVLDQYSDKVFAFDADAAQVWGRRRVPNPEHALDKQIAATALVHDLTVVTRNGADFAGTGVKVMNPIVAPASPQ